MSISPAMMYWRWPAVPVSLPKMKIMEDPRKDAEAVVLSGFDFETKERKRLSQNVGTKRQPAAATRGTCTIPRCAFRPLWLTDGLPDLPRCASWPLWLTDGLPDLPRARFGLCGSRTALPTSLGARPGLCGSRIVLPARGFFVIF